MRSVAPLAAAPAPAPPARTQPPRFRPRLVPRPRLVQRLMDCRDTPIALIVAPAGYGKSALLTEWAKRDERPFAWLTLAGGAADDAVRLTEQATARGVPEVIVIDDAHEASPAAVLRVVDAARRLPPRAMVALASRRHLPLPTGRLRVDRLMIEIAADDLAMTHLEAAMLLETTGLRLDGEQVDLLVERTEGWPAALYLAALSLAEQPRDDGALAGFTGADRLVAEYLGDELLAELDAEERTFMRRTSVLARLSGPLCDAVLDARGSTAVLESLRERGMPIEPMDRRDMGFRYHPLLAAALHAELLRLEPELEPALHRRAADWHAARGDPPEAIRHAVACRDGERAGRLLWSLAPEYVGGGRAAVLGECLGAFTERDLSAHASLALAAAAYHLAEGRRDHAERATDSAERALGALPDGEEHAGAVALLRACIARDGARRMGEDAAKACALAPPDSPWQSLGLLLSGIAHHLAGEREPARGVIEEAAGRAAGEMPVVDALCHAQLALLAVEIGEWDDAARHAREAQATLEPLAAPSAARALVLAVYAVVAAHRGDAAQARHDAADARHLLGSLDGFAPWLVAEALVWLARAAIRLSDGPTARLLLARAARTATLVGDAPVLSEWVHDGWLRADAFAESATGDGPTLTNAELRVLRLLPSHLSFREIGERLHVSPNTVKTQALSVYRKLDVSCRSGAVSRGRSAGLIDGA